MKKNSNNNLPFDEVYLFSLWYYPSHFGLHIDDVASAFRRKGIKTNIITVSKKVFQDSYFDSVRHMFIEKKEEPQNNVQRLAVKELTSRSYLAPIMTLDNLDALYKEISEKSSKKRILFFHVFESFIPYFNKDIFPEVEKCCVYYAGNFIARTIKEIGSSDFFNKSLIQLIIDANLAHLYTVDEKLKGVDFIVSETHSLVSMFQKAKPSISTRFFHRPFEHELVKNSKKINIRDLYHLDKDSIILVYAGRPTKNAEVLLDILRQIQSQLTKKVYLLLVGTQNYDLSTWKYYDKTKDSIIAIDFLDRATLYKPISKCILAFN